jgi:hypothetical protein
MEDNRGDPEEGSGDDGTDDSGDDGTDPVLRATTSLLDVLAEASGPPG